jgi:Family of unknown function (DUF6220)
MSDLPIRLELEHTIMSIQSIPPVVTSPPQQNTHARRRVPLAIYTALAVVFLLSVVVQVFLAGAGIFASASWLGSHGILGHVLPVIPLFMVILGLVGRLPRSVNWLTVLLLVLVYIQPWFIYLARGIGTPLLAALHPVNALAFFALALYLLYRTVQILRLSDEERRSPLHEQRERVFQGSEQQ